MVKREKSKQAGLQVWSILDRAVSVRNGVLRKLVTYYTTLGEVKPRLGR